MMRMMAALVHPWLLAVGFTAPGQGVAVAEWWPVDDVGQWWLRGGILGVGDRVRIGGGDLLEEMDCRHSSHQGTFAASLARQCGWLAAMAGGHSCLMHSWMQGTAG
jgi:hypothetical protein